jgi:nitroimidazol reductase NimA-like FMN-containing flavoprotein (pyridoxamine 5'-phosphate oxidase superfamily)
VSLEALDADVCLAMLRAGAVGRIGLVHDGAPLVLPVAYEVSTLDGDLVIAIRTRPGNVIDRSSELVCFQVDGIEPAADAGWSVLVHGVLRDVEPEGPVRARDAVEDGHDAWRVVVPTSITGRRLVADPTRWSFHPAGYL